MLFVIPLIVGFVAISFLIPWIHPQILHEIALLNWTFWKPIDPSFSDAVPEPVPVDLGTQPAATSSNVTYDPLLSKGSVISYKVLSNDLVNDCEFFLKQHKEKLTIGIIDLYETYVPDEVTKTFADLYGFWQTHSSYKLYKDYEDIVNKSLMFLGIVITIKLVRSLLSLIFSKPEDGKHDAPVKLTLEKNYLDFETIPMCVGKGDAEELLYIQTLQRESAAKHDSSLLRQFGIPTEEYGDDFLISTSTPNGLSGPVDITVLENTESLYLSEYSAADEHDRLQPALFSSDSTTNPTSSQSTSRSTTPEDSFERQEKSLDRNLSRLNNSVALDHPNTTPQASRVFDVLPKLGSSPSRNILYKRSISILTTPKPRPVTIAEPTVGDITQETVYSEPFSSDESLGSPINLNRKGKKFDLKKR